MEKFFCIKLINKNGERGYVIDAPEGIMIAKGGIVSGIARFETYSDAQKFMREHKLENNQVKAYIRDNNDLIRDEMGSGAAPIESDVFYLENENGEKAFYDTKQGGYYFKKGEVGFPVWETEKQCRDFIKVMDFPFAINVKKIEKK